MHIWEFSKSLHNLYKNQKNPSLMVKKVVKKTKQKAFCPAIKACPECGSENIGCREDKTEVICRDCRSVYRPSA